MSLRKLLDEAKLMDKYHNGDLPAEQMETIRLRIEKRNEQLYKTIEKMDREIEGRIAARQLSPEQLSKRCTI